MTNPDPQALIEDIEQAKRTLADCNETIYDLQNKRALAEKVYKDAVVNKLPKLDINQLKYEFELSKSEVSKVKGQMDTAKTTIDANRSLLRWYREEINAQ